MPTDIASHKEKIDMSVEMQARILATLKDIDDGFKRVMFMYVVTFYVGIGLILFSCISSFLSGVQQFTLLSGGLGVVDVVTFLIFKPAESLQISRGTLAQLISAFLTWYSDSKNSMQIYRKELTLEGADSINLYERVSQRNVQNTILLMEAINRFSRPLISKRRYHKKAEK